MASQNGRYWISYNGEIYNFRHLRTELEHEGYRFHSDCDTEVVLGMYERYHEAMLARLNGIFAIAIWDSVASELFLARDRLGVKPLYHMIHDDTLYFASEIKALLAAVQHPRLRREMIASYLTFLWVPDPDTLLEGVYKLPPGHYAVFSSAGFKTVQYWDMRYEPEARPQDHWSAEVRTTVQEAVRRQMVSDVPLGGFLSGGIDSSAIVAEMSRATGNVTTFTIGFGAQDLRRDSIPDDVHYARTVAQHFGVDYHEQILEANTLDLLPKLVWHMDDPVADPAAITTYLICSAARRSLTVILSGMGGDEVFAGYPRHLAARLGLMLEVVPRPLRTIARRLVQNHVTLGESGVLRGFRRDLMKLARGLDQSPAERYLTYCSYYRSAELARLLTEDTPLGDPFRQHRTYLDRVRGQHWLNQLLYLDLKTFLPCLNLSYTDKMSMAASAEVRVPLLDDEVVALSGRIPPELKLHHLTRKYVFKRSMEGVLPSEVINRPKAGFGVPLHSWLVGDLEPMVADLLSPETVRARGLFNPAEVSRLVVTNRSGQENNALRVWALLTLELWQRAFLDGSGTCGTSAAARKDELEVSRLV